MPLQGTPSFQHLHLFTNPRSIRSTFQQGFVWRLRYVSMTKSLAISDRCNLQRLCPPQRSGMELKSPTL